MGAHPGLFAAGKLRLHRGRSHRRTTAIPVGDVLPRVPLNSGRIAARYRVLNGAAKGLSFGAGVTAPGAHQDTLPNSI